MTLATTELVCFFRLSPSCRERGAVIARMEDVRLLPAHDEMNLIACVECEAVLAARWEKLKEAKKNEDLYEKYGIKEGGR